MVAGTTPLTPVVTIKYKVGTEPDPVNGRMEVRTIPFLTLASSDTRCAAVYLTDETDVAFRPFGLDLFDKLAKAWKVIRARLESEQRALDGHGLSTLQATNPEGSVIARLLANLNSLTKPEVVTALAQLSPEEETRLAVLEKSLLRCRRCTGGSSQEEPPHAA